MSNSLRLVLSWPQKINSWERDYMSWPRDHFCRGNPGVATWLPLSLAVEVFCAVSGQTLP